MGEARIEEDVEGKKCKERKADIVLFRDRKTPTTYIHALENKIPKPNRKQLDTGKLIKGPSSFFQRRVGEPWTACCLAGPIPTFTIVVGLGDLQKCKDAGHATQTCVGVGLLQTEDRALEQV